MKLFFIFILFFVVINEIAIGYVLEEKLTYIDNALTNRINCHINAEREEYRQNNCRCEQNSNKAASSVFDIRVDTFPERCKTKAIPKNCAEATACIRRSGYYRILLDKYSSETFLVECDVKTEGGDWTVIQRREDGTVDFYRDWAEYQRGFGNIEDEFFIGLDRLHALTNFNGPQELLVLLHDKNETRKAFYSNFVVGSELESYALKKLGLYSGDAGDSLRLQMGMKFTTKDRDNDLHKDNCAKLCVGAWWYRQCHHSNLNGHYGDNVHGKGINWYAFRGHEASIERVTMMIRRRPY